MIDRHFGHEPFDPANCQSPKELHFRQNGRNGLLSDHGCKSMDGVARGVASGGKRGFVND
ncbi:hypothetical protein ATM17_16465 [Sphingopyxis macrogoltabida]|uniref:Uncharacterized protein n=1 Tax=Sphingopyxis macrogoltabida TaxID=33050 RepID=A0AAC9FFV0_SPHMC|nr:hypothetical protein LH19_15885 [Sphingopyxis macrogoltabida]AMU90618.1 hypothetical protein ATM17_16465 [Sphingopyxis macrogoltabida]